MLFPAVSQSQALSQTPQKTYGGTFTWGFYHKPSAINPIFTTQTVSAALCQLIFNGLVRINSQGESEPDLARSWAISADGLTYTFYLRKGVKFHDGQECTAFDVEFTYNKLIDPAVNSPFKNIFQLVSEFKAIDRYTFRVTLKEPSTPFIYYLTKEIVPRHLLEQEDLAKGSFNFNPVGTGPFRFKGWTEDDRITLEYNPDYYEGRPYLDKIVVKTYSNSDDVWTALMRGEVDCVQFIEQKDYEVIKNDPAFKAHAVAVDYYYALVYNLDDPVLADKKIREAIAYAVDRKSLIQRVAGGYGIECSGPFFPDSLGFNPQVKPFEYNPQEAQRLLAEAGWQDYDNDGILEKDGEELEINVLVDSRNDIYEKTIMVLRQQLQEIGIKIKVELYNDDSRLNKEFINSKKIQAHLTLLLGGLDPDQIAEVWGFQEGKSPDKLWKYKNEEVDNLFASGKISQDRQKRKETYQKIHQLIYQDQPACFLYFPFFFHAISARFKNTDAYFTLNMPTYTIKNFWLNQAPRAK
jgi:peptide/nickel transport system substrate-binding protein